MLIRKPYAEQMQWCKGHFSNPDSDKLDGFTTALLHSDESAQIQDFGNSCSWLVRCYSLQIGGDPNAKRHGRQVKKQRASFNNVTWSPKLLHWQLFQVFEWQRRARVIDHGRHEIYFTDIRVITNPLFPFVCHVSESYDVNAANSRTKVYSDFPSCCSYLRGHSRELSPSDICSREGRERDKDGKLEVTTKHMRMNSTKLNRHDSCS